MSLTNQDLCLLIIWSNQMAKKQSTKKTKESVWVLFQLVFFEQVVKLILHQLRKILIS